MKELLIIIINYRTADILIDCLVTLIPNIADIDASVAIIDNSSGDDSIPKINKWIADNNAMAQVELIASKHNTGFSGGNNIGIKYQQANHYFLINSDTLIQRGAIRELLKAAHATTNVGLVTPRLEWPDGSAQESCFRFHTPISEFIITSKTGFITRIFEKYNVPIPVTNDTSQPDWSSFACVLIKKQVFDDVGLMDDGYFMYFEDAEFCYRARKAGWKVLNQPDAHVVHLRGGSSPVKENTKLKKRLPRYYYESRTRFFYQLYGWSGLTLANILWSTGRVISKFRQLFGRSDKAVSDKQWLDIWTNWLNPLKSYVHPDDYK